MGDDLHAREEQVQVPRDDVLERDEGVLVDLDEARQHLLRHLHPRVQRRVCGRVVELDEQAQREVRDVGEGAARPDRQRRQHGEDVLPEVALNRLRQGARLRTADDADALLGEGRAHDLGELVRMARVHLPELAGEPVHHLGRREAVGPARVHPGLDLPMHARHSHHEELVEVRGVDRQELQPLEQGHGAVFAELEHPVVEVEPGELAVDVEARICEVGLGGGGGHALLDCHVCDSSSTPAIAPSSAGVNNNTSRSPSIAARPALRSGARAPVASRSACVIDGLWPTSNTSP